MTSSSTTSRTASRPAATRAGRIVTVVGLVVPLVLVTASVVVMLVALPSLPAEVVVNWGVDGDVARGPAWTYPVVTGVIGITIPTLMWATSARGRRAADGVVLMAAVSLGLAVFIAVAMPWALIAQPTDLAAAVPFVAAIAIAIGVGAAAWFVLPRDPAVPRDDVVVAPIAQPAGARSAWTSVARMTVGARAAIAGAVVLSAVVASVGIVAAGAAASALFALPLVLAFLFGTLTAFRVSTGPTGLVVRSVVGWPVFRVPATDIDRVELVQVDPMADFGGWGLRLGLVRDGAPRRAFGVILRAGEGIEALRRDGRRFVVTVDDAQTGAAVLAAAARDAAAVG